MFLDNDRVLFGNVTSTSKGQKLRETGSGKDPG